MQRSLIAILPILILIGCTTTPHLPPIVDSQQWNPGRYSNSLPPPIPENGELTYRGGGDDTGFGTEGPPDIVDLDPATPGNGNWPSDGFDFGVEPVDPTNPWTDIDEGGGTGLATTVSMERRWQPIYFAYNQSGVGTTERTKLEVLADHLVGNHQFHLVIEGHCDGRGSDEFNRSLGESRAIAVRDYLAGLGVPSTRMRTLSYGEDKLADSGEGERAHAKNRRAEFVVLTPRN
jgi:peptidoglycan-associated lipoprotein